ncbi:hypothetical protein CEY16_00975 [Halalkalibacillus sediminis]|uniref:Uncharacterized protein n=1 Tax=Halalkalibacillus sediminis TaxID=2018042 RepID=A0A2I0QVI7_9BACI|nr:hypothetical protein [Halalkalibacillus sediminis]PKR78362.1 hypothetical protein CEY16_00975 [Halalkalibacillus sediminis]
MSDSKKEIHVKDLVIKADNVIFEQPRRENPFFGPRKMEEEAIEDIDKREDVAEETDDDNDRKPPFYWI